jgi:hypothetical protein
MCGAKHERFGACMHIVATTSWLAAAALLLRKTPLKPHSSQFAQSCIHKIATKCAPAAMFGAEHDASTSTHSMLMRSPHNHSMCTCVWRRTRRKPRGLTKYFSNSPFAVARPLARVRVPHDPAASTGNCTLACRACVVWRASSL